jgi:hypothetical protein
VARSKLLKVELHSPDGEVSKGEITLIEWEPRDCSRRAMKALGICWGLALFSIIIPIAHFILVPGFLLAGPFVAFFTYSTKSIVDGGTGSCPGCGVPFVVSRMKPNWPLDELCTRCHSRVSIFLHEDVPAPLG